MNEYRNSSEQLTYDFEHIKINNYFKVCKKIVKHFKLKESGQLVHGLDETFQEYKLGRFIIGLEWDIWSGYIVVAKNKQSEALVREIAEFINEAFAKIT